MPHRVVGRRPLAGVVILLLLTGCGAVLTAGIAGGVLGLGGGGGKGGGNSGGPTVGAASATPNPNAGTVSIDFTLSSPSSQNASVQVLYSLDGTTFNPATAVSFRGPGGSVDPTKVPTAPGGIPYVFTWNSSRDLGPILQPGVTLQIRLNGIVAFTFAPILVDDTGVPAITGAALPALPTGASVYADEQFGGAIPVTVTVAQAQGNSVTLQVLYSTNAFVTTNTAAGILTAPGNPSQQFDLSSVPALASGSTYTFLLDSSGNGLGATKSQTFTLRFIAAENVGPGEVPKTSPPTDLTVTVDNVFFTASIFLPSGTQVTDNVQVPFALFSAAGDPLVASFLFTVNGGAGWQSATPIAGEPPGDVSNPPGPLASSAAGTNHVFIWNAYFDMLASGFGVPSSSGVELTVTITNTLTGVSKGTTPGSIASPQFSVDQRLIYTVFSRNQATLNGVSPPTNARVVLPLGIAFVPVLQKLFFCDNGGGLVLVVNSPGTPQARLNTAFGGGVETAPGSLATNFAISSPTDVAAAPDGTIFVCASVQGAGQADLFRVDGSTPIVTYLDGGGVGSVASDFAPKFVCFEPTGNSNKGMLYCVETEHPDPANTWTVIRSVFPDGSAPPQIIAGATPGPPDVAGVSTADGVLATQAAVNALGIAANFGAGQGAGPPLPLVFYSDLIQSPPSIVPVIRAINTGSQPLTYAGVTINPGCVATVVAGFSVNQTTPFIRVAIDPGNGDLYVSTNATTASEVYQVTNAGGTAVVTSLVGTGIVGFSGDGGPPLAAQCEAEFMTSDGQGGLFFTDLTGRVRHAVFNPAPGVVTSVAGGLIDEGDGQPACAAQFTLPTAIAAIPNGFVVSELSSLLIRSIDASSTIIQTIAGNGTSGVAPNLPPPAVPLAALNQPFGAPNGLTSDPAGNIYVSQPTNSIVQALVPQASGGYAVVRVAGNGSTGNPTDNMQAVSQPLQAPRALGFGGQCLVVPQSTEVPFAGPGFVSAVNVGAMNSTTWGQMIPAGAICRIAGALSGGAIVDSTTPGQAATNAGLPSPTGAAVSTKGEIYVSDAVNNEVYRIDPTGSILLVAGNRFTSAGGGPDQIGGGLPATALGVRLRTPEGIAIVNSTIDILYIYDSGNNRIRLVNLDGSTTATVHGLSVAPGTIVTVGGDGRPPGANGNGDDKSAVNAHLNLSFFVTSMLAQNDSLYFADQGAARIRVIDASGIIRTFAGGGALDGDAPTAVVPYSAPGRTADNAALTRPTALAVAADGTFYVVDAGRIRAVDPITTAVSRIAGTAFQQSAGDGLLALDASFEYRTENTTAPVITSDFDGPRQIALAPSVGAVTSVIIVADTLSTPPSGGSTGSVRVVNLTAGILSLAGGTVVVPPNGVASLPQPPGSLDGPFGAKGSTDGLEGVAINSSGVVAVSDIKAGKVNLLLAFNLSNAVQPLQCLDGSGTTFTTIAPGAWAALVSATDTNVFGPSNTLRPRNLAFSPSGHILAFTLSDESGGTDDDYVAALDVSPASVALGTERMWGLTLTPGVVAPLTTTTGGKLVRLRGIAADPVTGDLYVADRGDNPLAPTPGAAPTNAFVYGITASTGEVLTVAGIGSAGAFGDGGLATQAQLDFPFSVGVDGAGSVYVLDSGTFRIRRCRKFP